MSAACDGEEGGRKSYGPLYREAEACGSDRLTPYTVEHPPLGPSAGSLAESTRTIRKMAEIRLARVRTRGWLGPPIVIAEAAESLSTKMITDQLGTARSPRVEMRFALIACALSFQPTAAAERSAPSDLPKPEGGER